jgi:hypothetical protein
MPGVSLEAPVDHGEPDEIALGDKLIRDRRVTPAVDRLPIRRPAVDHGHTAVQNHGEVPVGAAAGIERYGGRCSVAQQVELWPAGGVLDGRVLADDTGVVVRTQPETAGVVVVEDQRHRRVRHGEVQVVPSARGQAQSGVAHLAGLAEIAAVGGRHPEGRSGEREPVGIRVGVDQPQPHLRTGRRGVLRAPVPIGEHDGAVERVHGQSQIH